MRKVHPKVNGAIDVVESAMPAMVVVAAAPGREEETEFLTVWRKSMLLDGKGFTVFDGKGDLVFRVDNYASENKGEIVLMDGTGKPLLTIRRKKLSLGDHWLIYDGEETSNPRFLVKKQINLLQSKSLVHINHYSSKMGSGSRGNSPCSSPKSIHLPSSMSSNGGSPSSSSSPCSSPRWASSSSASIAFDVQGSYTQRCCIIYDEMRHQMAEIKRKESNIGEGVNFGLDVFRLVVQPGFDAAIAMAIVILLEQMFGSKSSLLIKA